MNSVSQNNLNWSVSQIDINKLFDCVRFAICRLTTTECKENNVYVHTLGDQCLITNKCTVIVHVKSFDSFGSCKIKVWYMINFLWTKFHCYIAFRLLELTVCFSVVVNQILGIVPKMSNATAGVIGVGEVWVCGCGGGGGGGGVCGWSVGLRKLTSPYAIVIPWYRWGSTVSKEVKLHLAPVPITVFGSN